MISYKYSNPILTPQRQIGIAPDFGLALKTGQQGHTLTGSERAPSMMPASVVAKHQLTRFMNNDPRLLTCFSALRSSRPTSGRESRIHSSAHSTNYHMPDHKPQIST